MNNNLAFSNEKEALSDVTQPTQLFPIDHMEILSKLRKEQ